jgi:nitroimidazol reductase NimA-like FMN-containing flavoprotein (pyridoxamine 5'-phosphate oxidase superfamily)
MEDMPGIPWERVERRLRNSETYWLATTRPDGRPHSMPVYGLWRDRAFWFGTDRESVKGRNLAANSGAVVHLESAGDVVIVEGRAEPVGDPATSAAVTPLLAAKYGVGEEELALGRDGSGGALYLLRPRVVHAWLEGAFPQTRSRWVLG